MKETVKTSRTAGYLEKIFRALNAKYFNGELEEPIITIQSTPRAYGHVTVAKAWQRGDTTRHELNIGAGTLARPIENVVATTLHECVHLWNLQNGMLFRIVDCQLVASCRKFFCHLIHHTQRTQPICVRYKAYICQLCGLYTDVRG